MAKNPAVKQTLVVFSSLHMVVIDTSFGIQSKDQFAGCSPDERDVGAPPKTHHDYNIRHNTSFVSAYRSPSFDSSETLVSYRLINVTVVTYAL